MNNINHRSFKELNWSCKSNTSSASLLSRLIKIIRWATETVSKADSNSSIWCPPEDESSIRPIDKMLLEASVLAMVSGRCEEVRPAARDLIEAVANHSHSIDRVYGILRKRPHLRTSLGILWVALEEFNCGKRYQIDALKALWHDDPIPPQHQERVPYRLLDQAWVRSKALKKIDKTISSGILIPFTTLGNLGGAPFMSRDDLYALTHTAMYISDFGGWSLSQSYSSELIGAVTMNRVLDGDYDLVAELAFTDVLLGDQNSHIGQILARVVLNDIYDSVGFIPSLSFNPVEYKSTSHQDTYLCFHSYHTMFVYALLCYAVLLKQNYRFEPQLSDFYKRTWDIDAMANFNTNLDSNPLDNMVTDIANQTLKWTDDCISRGIPFNKDGSHLLRGVVDAYMIKTLHRDAVDQILQLIKMSEVAGKSEIEYLICKYILQRSKLSPNYKPTHTLQDIQEIMSDYSNHSFNT